MAKKKIYRKCKLIYTPKAKFPKHQVEVVCKLSKSEFKEKPFTEGGTRDYNIKFIRERK